MKFGLVSTKPSSSSCTARSWRKRGTRRSLQVRRGRNSGSGAVWFSRVAGRSLRAVIPSKPPLRSEGSGRALSCRCTKGAHPQSNCTTTEFRSFLAREPPIAPGRLPAPAVRGLSRAFSDALYEVDAPGTCLRCERTWNHLPAMLPHLQRRWVIEVPQKQGPCKVVSSGLALSAGHEELSPSNEGVFGVKRLELVS